MSKYYLKIDGNEMGPYSAREVRNMHVDDGVEVRIEGSGVWMEARCLNFERLMVQELLEESRMKVQRGELVELPVGVGDMEARHWNWGACFMPGFWGLFNGVYWPLGVLALIVLLPISVYVMWGVWFVVMMVMGVMGGRWSWRRNKWDSVEHYMKVQHRWAIVGMAYFLLRLCGELLFWLL